MQILNRPQGLLIFNAGNGDAKLHTSRPRNGLNTSHSFPQFAGSVHEEAYSRARAISSSPVNLTSIAPGGDGPPQETVRESRMRHYAHSAGRLDVVTSSERGGIKVESHPSPFSLVSGNNNTSSTRTMLHPPRLVPIRVVNGSKNVEFEPFERSGFLHASLRSGDAFEGGGVRELYSRSGHIMNASPNNTSPTFSFSSSRSSSPTASSRSSPVRLRESFFSQDGGEGGRVVHEVFAETMFSNRLSLSSEQMIKIEAISRIFSPYLFGDKVGAFCHFNDEPNIDLSIRVWTLSSQVFSEATSVPGVTSLQPLEFDAYARDIARSICALVNGTFHSLSRLSVQSNLQNASAKGAQLGLWTSSKVESRFHSAVHSAEFELKTMLNTSRSALEKSTHMDRLEEEKEREERVYRATASPILFSNSIFENPLEPKGTVVGLRFDPLKKEVPPSIRLSATLSFQRGEDSYKSPSPTFRQHPQSSGFSASKPVDLSHVTASLASTLDSILSGPSSSPLSLPPCVLATQEKGTVPRTTILGTKTSPRLMVLSETGKWIPGQRMRSSIHPQGGQEGNKKLFNDSTTSSLNSLTFREKPSGGPSGGSPASLKIMNASMRETLAPPGTLSPSFRETVHSLSSSLSASKRPEVKHVLMNLASSSLERVLM